MQSDLFFHISCCLEGGRAWSVWKQYLALQNKPSNLNSETTSHDHCARTQENQITKISYSNNLRRFGRHRRARKDKWEPAAFIDWNEKVWFRPLDGSFEINRHTLPRTCRFNEGARGRFKKPRFYFCTSSAKLFGIFRLITCIGKIPWPDKVVQVGKSKMPKLFMECSYICCRGHRWAYRHCIRNNMFPSLSVIHSIR